MGTVSLQEKKETPGASAQRKRPQEDAEEKNGQLQATERGLKGNETLLTS